MKWIEIKVDRFHIKNLRTYYLIDDFILIYYLFVNLTMSKWLDLDLTTLQLNFKTPTSSSMLSIVLLG